MVRSEGQIERFIEAWERIDEARTVLEDMGHKPFSGTSSLEWDAWMKCVRKFGAWVLELTDPDDAIDDGAYD